VKISLSERKHHLSRWIDAALETVDMQRKVEEFHDNQHTSEADTDFVSTSAEKLKNNSDFEVNYDSGFMF